VLVDLATISGTAHGQLVASQLMDVTVRVAPVRPFVVEAMLGLLLDTRLVLGPGRATLHEVGRVCLCVCCVHLVGIQHSLIYTDAYSLSAPISPDMTLHRDFF